MSALRLHSFSALQNALHHAFEEFGPRTALIEVDRDREKEHISYTELQNQATTFSRKLLYHGFAKGRRMAILMTNQSKWIISASGLFYVGGTLVPLDFKQSPSDQLKLFVHSEADFLVIEYPLWLRLRTVDSEQILSSKKVFVTEAPASEKIEGAYRFEEEVNLLPDFSLVSSSRDDVACIVYSSGTGGTPKGCMLTHGNYLAQAQALAELYPIREQDAYFSFIPTNHAIDFMCGFLLPLFFGSKVVHQRTLRPEYLLSTIQNYRISHMALVPMLLKVFQDRIKEKISRLSPVQIKIFRFLTKIHCWITRTKPRYWISRLLFWPIHQGFGGKLRLIFAGGAFVDSSTAQFFYDLGIPVVIGYGLTEAGTVLTVNDLHPFRADTVGKPLYTTEIKIHEPDEHGVGEVWAKGSTVMKGYWKSPELTEAALENGWLKTGDLGRLDGEHLILVGRKKNMIVTPGGKNVYPEDVESAFHQIRGIEEFCILAKRLIWNNSDLTEDSMIMIVKPKDDIRASELLNHIRERNRSLSEYKRVSELLVWNLPFSRTASLKIKREELAQVIAKSLENPGAGVVQL